jgi:hypothetical protein
MRHFPSILTPTTNGGAFLQQNANLRVKCHKLCLSKTGVRVKEVSVFFPKLNKADPDVRVIHTMFED